MTASQSRSPSWWYLALAPVFMIIGVSAFIWCIVHFVKAVAHEPARFDVPGEFQTAFDKPGNYAIYQEYPTDQSPLFDGTPAKPYPVCSVVSADGQRQIKVSYASGSLEQGINDRTYTAIYDFVIDQPGEYRITCQPASGPESHKFILGVGPQMNVAGPIASMFIGPAVCCGSFVLALVVVIVFLVLRSSADRRPPTYPPATPFPPLSRPPNGPPQGPPGADGQ